MLLWPHARLLLLATVYVTSCTAQSTQPVDPWPALLATMSVARPSSVYEFTDYEVPRDPSIRTKCLGARFCDCTISSGFNRTFWLNTASAVFNGQVYLAILQRTVTLRSVVHYRQNNKTQRGQVFEANSLLFCKAQLLPKFELKRDDCKLVEPGPGYQEKHPYPPRGHHFDLNGLIDPRLISAGDGSGLFLQAGCRPRHLAENNANRTFREALCLVKLMDGKPSAREPSQRQLLAAAPDKGKQLKSALPPPLPGMTIHSADWPLGKLMSLSHATGHSSWEKSWVPFTYKGTVLWSRSLSPHQVVTVHANGVASTLYRVENKEVFSPLKTVCGTGPRGNTPAVLIPAEQSGLPRPVYLNILHVTPHRKSFAGALDRSCHEYLNFFYLMDSEPPFNILEVARPPIPLVAATNPVLDNPPLSFGMGYISFPTGLVVLEDKVIVTYGSGDTSLRIFTTSLQDVLNTFTHNWIDHPPNSTLIADSLSKRHV